MAKFYRKIRQKLLVENRFNKYLLYAIGEIVLVVIGILIAIKINDWNSKIANEKKIKLILNQVATELDANILTAETIVDYYTEKDSIFDLVLSEKTNIENFDYNRDSAQLYLLFTAGQFNAERKGFDILVENLDNIPKNFNEIVRDLQELHKKTLISIGNSYKRMDYISDTFRTHLTYKTTWFYQFYRKDAIINDTIIKYFYNNATYKNNLTWYRTAMTNNYTKKLRSFIHEARRVKQLINTKVNLNDNPKVDYLNNVSNQNKIIGTYYDSVSDKKIKIYLNNDDLMITLPNGNDSKLYFTNENTFFYNSGLKGKIINNTSLIFKTNLKGFFESSTFQKMNI